MSKISKIGVHPETADDSTLNFTTMSEKIDLGIVLVVAVQGLSLCRILTLLDMAITNLWLVNTISEVPRYSRRLGCYCYQEVEFQGSRNSITPATS